jgi:hypothetical protein
MKNKFITIVYFQRGSICSADFENSEREVLLNKKEVSEIGNIEKFNKEKYFTLTMTNGNRYFLRPQRYESIIDQFK